MLNSPFDKVIADNEIETLRALYRQDTGAHPLVSVVLHPDVQQPAQIGVNTRRALRHVLNVFPDWDCAQSALIRRGANFLSDYKMRCETAGRRTAPLKWGPWLKTRFAESGLLLDHYVDGARSWNTARARVDSD